MYGITAQHLVRNIKVACRLLPSLALYQDDFIMTRSKELITNVPSAWSLRTLFNKLKDEQIFHNIPLLDVILYDNNHLLDLTLDTASNILLYELSRPIIYLFLKPYQRMSFNENKYEPNFDILFDQTDKSCSETTSSGISDGYRWHASRHRIHSHFEEYKTNLQFKATESSIRFPEYQRRELFAHIYIVNQLRNSNDQYQAITQIKSLPNSDTYSTMQEIRKIVNEYCKSTSIDNLAIIVDGYEISNEQFLNRETCPFITVMRCLSLVNMSSFVSKFKAHEMTIRLCIYLVVFDKKYSYNIERFFNYCDRNQSFELEKRELEIALLTLVELFNGNLSERLPRFTYYDVVIPQSKGATWNYSQCKLLFADTLIEYIRTRCLPLSTSNESLFEKESEWKLSKIIPEFVHCLHTTLDISLKTHSRSPAETSAIPNICRTTIAYLFSIPFSPILFVYTLLMYLLSQYRQHQQKEQSSKSKNFNLTSRYFPDRIIWTQLLSYVCSTLLVVPVLNIILYYSHSDRAPVVNQLEVYYPLALIVTAMIVLHVYQTSSIERITREEKNLIQRTHFNAHLAIPEVKSNPIVGMPISDSSDKSLTYEFLNKKQLDQTSLTRSLIQLPPIGDYFRSNKTIWVFFSLIIIGIVSVHACIPTIHRYLKRNELPKIVPWYILSIRYSYIGFSVIFYTLFIGMMIASITYYWRLLDVLRRLLSRTKPMQEGDLVTPYFLNMRRAENLEYFLGLIRSLKRRIDRDHLFISIMTCALLIDIIFIITVAIHIIRYGRSTDLLFIWYLIDIVILSFFIMLFVTIVVLINASVTYDFIRHLRDLKKEMVTSTIVHGSHVDNAEYLDIVIQHMEGVSDVYSVKLLGFVVDYSFAIKVLISIITGIVSCILTLIEP